MINHNEKTIIALCTPRGNGAIALIRLSGEDAIEIANKIGILHSEQKILTVPSHTIHFGHIVDANNNLIDQVMLIIMKSPKTFTGENVVEITCHNNPFIIEEIILQAIKNGARNALPGEFAKRAFLNNKIDLIQAESINDLIHAHTQQAIKKSLCQLEGSFSNWLSMIEEKLVRCLALCESSIEFLDEEIEFGHQIKDEVDAITTQIFDAKKQFNNQQQIKEGIRVAIIGSVNAGKSSLFNRLLNKNRAIVTAEPGTTRDSIEAGIYQENFYMTLVDTAGLRQTENIIEQEGIKRSFDEAKKADIILLVFDSSKKTTDEELKIYQQIKNEYESKIIFVCNKSDLNENNSSEKQNLNCENKIQISTKTNNNLDLLEKKIIEKVKLLLEKNDSPFLLNQRQYQILIDLENKLETLIQNLKGPIEYELISIHINEALQIITELYGKSITEKSLDKIFQEFCVGK